MAVLNASACDQAEVVPAQPASAAASDAAQVPCSTPEDCVHLGSPDACVVATCDVTSDLCIVLPVPDGTACASSEQTCGAPGVCAGGRCVGEPIDQDACDDGNPCTVDVCAPGAGCSSFAIPDGSACDDERACTSSDACIAGACQGVQADPDCVEPACGDGVCGPGEVAEDCPEDCVSGSSGLCGDGECSEEETAESCFEDCGRGEPVCGDGLCEGAESFFCPQDCQ